MSGGMEHCAELERRRKEAEPEKPETAIESLDRVKHETERMIQYSAEMILKFKIQHDALKEHLDTINELIEKT